MKNDSISFKELEKKWLKNPEFKKEWDTLEPEYQMDRKKIKAQIERENKKKLLQKKLKTA